MNVEAIEEASSCLQKVADNVKELVESENGIATILNDHRSYLADPTIPIYAKLLSKHSMTNTKELEKIMKKQAYFFGERGKCSTSREKRGLCLPKSSIEMLQNLPYLWNMKSKVCKYMGLCSKKSGIIHF